MYLFLRWLAIHGNVLISPGEESSGSEAHRVFSFYFFYMHPCELRRYGPPRGGVSDRVGVLNIKRCEGLAASFCTPGVTCVHPQTRSS